LKEKLTRPIIKIQSSPVLYTVFQKSDAAKRIFNSDKICRSYSDLNFGVTFLEHSVVLFYTVSAVTKFTRLTRGLDEAHHRLFPT